MWEAPVGRLPIYCACNFLYRVDLALELCYFDLVQGLSGTYCYCSKSDTMID